MPDQNGSDVLYRIGADTSDGQRAMKDFSALTVAQGQIIADVFKAIGEASVKALKAATDAGMAFEASMSQVAATMGTTVDQISELSDIAKQMGANTQFTATQAGDALNYLALAGYDAEKQIAALPVVLNLAAAGGMELARASDMVTDSMAALGIEMSELESYSDQMAKTAQKSNTNVTQLGEAILTVGGTAKALKNGTVELNTALGILADNGIKASEGGTQLRNLLMNLTAPTTKAADQLTALGVSVYDANGNIRGLNDIFGDLDASLSTLTDQQRMQALSDIFDTRTLKSAQALLANYGERWDELSGYIANADGACEDMAKTMNDNLKGDVIILNSALEGLGITASEAFNGAFRTAVQTASEEISKLNDSMSEGELQESLQRISEGFGELAGKVTDLLVNDVLPAAIKGMEWIVDHGDGIVTTIKAVGAAFLTYKAISAVINSVTIAQTALNAVMAANPILLVTSALAGLVIGLNSMKDPMEKLHDEAVSLNDAFERQQDKVEKLTEEYDQSKGKLEELNRLKTDGTISAAQATELKQLEAQTAELNRQVEAEKMLLEIRRQEAGLAALDEANGTGNTTGTTDEFQYVVDYMVQSYREVEEAEKSLADARKTNNAELIANWEAELNLRQQSLEAQKGGMLESIKIAEELQARLDQTTESGQAAYKQIEGLIDQAYNLVGITGDGTSDGTQAGGDYSSFDTQAWYTAYAASEREKDAKRKQLNEARRSAQKKELDEQLQLLKDDYNFGLMTEAEYYNTLENKLHEFTTDQRGEYKDYFLDIHKYRVEAAEDAAKIQESQLEAQEAATEKSVSEHMSAIETIARTYQSALDKVEDERDNIKNSAANVGGMLDFSVNETVVQNDPSRMDRTVTRTGGVNGAAKAMRQRLSDIKLFTEGIKSLKAKGVPAGVISEILSMDFEDGLEAVKGLQSASMADLMDYSAAYTELQKQSEQLSSDMVKTESEAITDAFETTLSDYIEGMPEEFREAGFDSMISFAKGMNQAGVSLMDGVALLAGDSSVTDLTPGSDSGSFGIDMAAAMATPTNTSMSAVDLSPVTSAVSSASSSPGSRGTISVSVPVMLDGVQVAKSVAKNINLDNTRSGGNAIR